MALAGNLTTITIDDTALRGRFPLVDRWLPAEQPDWEPQRTIAVAEALVMFRQATGEDPTWVVPADPAAWQAILAAHTLVTIIDGMHGEDWLGERDKWAKKRDDGYRTLQYRVDFDRDGSLDSSIEEGAANLQTIELHR